MGTESDKNNTSEGRDAGAGDALVEFQHCGLALCMDASVGD